MRIFLAMAALITLSGCQKDFEDQYAETEQKLKAQAEQLDKEMAKEAAKESSRAGENP